MQFAKLFVVSANSLYNRVGRQKNEKGENMAISYNKLWKLMIDKKINKSQLCKKIKISSSTMAKMTNEEMVAMTVLEKICAELECDISDIMEFTDLAEVKKKIHNENTSPDNGTVNAR